MGCQNADRLFFLPNFPERPAKPSLLLSHRDENADRPGTTWEPFEFSDKL